MTTKRRLLCAAAGFILIAPLVGRVDIGDYQESRSRDTTARALRNRSAAAIMMGEARTAVSDIMFIKTERYLHSGVAYVPHMERQLLSVSGSDDVAGVSHAAVGTIVRREAEDFRGFIGRLHREVKPWVDPKKGHVKHTDGAELLPWFRVMTLSDPHFVRGYAVGGWWLKSKNVDAALEFVDEGIRNNPNAFQIYHTKGLILKSKGDAERKGSDNVLTEEGERYYLLAWAAFKRAVTLAIRQRPRGWNPESPSPLWNHYMEDDAFAAARMVVLMERDSGDKAKAKKLAREYLDALGEDLILQRLSEMSL